DYTDRLLGPHGIVGSWRRRREPGCPQTPKPGGRRARAPGGGSGRAGGGREAAGAALERIGGERADWGLVFATPGHRPQYAPLLAEVQKTLGTACLAGCSGAGVIGAGEEIEGGHGVAILAVRSDVLHAETHLVPGGDDQGKQA